MILNGLGGQELSRQHAINSAKLVNETQPHYLATLVVSFPMGDRRFRDHVTNGIALLNQRGLFEETTISEVASCLSYKGKANTVDNMDAAIKRGIKKKY